MSDTQNGWQPHPTKPGKFGYFDGTEWSNVTRDTMPDDVSAPPTAVTTAETTQARTPPEPVNPGLVITLGLVAQGIGAFLFVNASDNDSSAGTIAGAVIGGIGAIILLIGVIAMGVAIALRHDRFHHR